MTRFIRATAVAALVLTAAVAGCARRPALTAMSTPAPAAPSAAPRPTEVIVLEQKSDAVAAAVTDRPAPAEFTEAAALKNAYFDFDRYDIRPDDAKTLEASAAWLKRGDWLVLIEGQCDERGTEAYNLALGERRASAAKNYLIAYGIAANRITTLSLGKERPVCAEHSEACWAQNRRAHFLVKPGE